MNRMHFFAHRGDNKNHQENTLLAFESSLHKGFRAFELDLRRTADDHVVLFHDDTLERHGRPDLNAGELTLEEFRELVPSLTTFHDLRAYFARMGVTINLEIKDGPETLQRILPHLGDFRRVVISSFDHRVVDLAVEAGLEAGYLMETLEEPAGRFMNTRLHVPFQGSDEDFRTLEKLRDYQVYCYTVNRPETAVRLMQYGQVHGIFTDNRDLPKQCLYG